MNNKLANAILIILAILVITVGGVFIYKYLTRSEQTNSGVDIENESEEIVESEPEKEVQIFKGTDRPIAVMIDNLPSAWPQANLNKAYLVYEILAEGGATRLMALFKGQDLEEIGPVRSSRHYFLDYALENDAIYVHHGFSPQAKSDIAKLGINNVDGYYEENDITKDFWRVKDKTSPHNSFTSTDAILKIALREGYKIKSEVKSVLNYVANEIELTDRYEIEIKTENENVEDETDNSAVIKEDDGKKTKALVANNVTIPHSSLQIVKYEYDEETKTYTRYAGKRLQTDYVTGEPITTKNIIITMCDNYNLKDTEDKGRQGIKNIGTLDGYYITNGYAIPITCTKNARDEQTVYQDLDGNEIKVNDGNTFINICPTDAELVIE